MKAIQIYGNNGTEEDPTSAAGDRDDGEYVFVLF